jgi:hypothetical protein
LAKAVGPISIVICKDGREELAFGVSRLVEEEYRCGQSQ